MGHDMYFQGQTAPDRGSLSVASGLAGTNIVRGLILCSASGTGRLGLSTCKTGMWDILCFRGMRVVELERIAHTVEVQL